MQRVARADGCHDPFADGDHADGDGTGDDVAERTADDRDDADLAGIRTARHADVRPDHGCGGDG